MQRGFTRRGGTSPASESKVLKLKGLPYATKEADLLDFFRDFKLIRVALVAEPDGRPSGLVRRQHDVAVISMIPHLLTGVHDVANLCCSAPGHT